MTIFVRSQANQKKVVKVMPNGQDPVILSHENTGQITINIEDPNKPKQPQKFIKKTEPKESVSAKVKHAFLGPDVDKVGDYILKEYMVPTGKKLLNSGIQGLLRKLSDGVQVLLFGRVVSTQNGGVDYTSFANPSVGSSSSGQNSVKAYKLMDAVETFTFPTRQVAQDTLDYLRGRIKTYGSTSVADYYEYIGSAINYMMVDKGWVNLDGARVISTPEGFIIDLPRPISLKRG